jgi:hypothetical protein
MTSSFFRACLSFISNTMMMSIVQTLASILVCDSQTNMLQIDASITCWSGFHRSVAVLSMWGAVVSAPSLVFHHFFRFLLAFFVPAGWIFGYIPISMWFKSSLISVHFVATLITGTYRSNISDLQLLELSCALQPTSRGVSHILK